MNDALRAEAYRAYDEFFRLCIARPELATFENARKNLKISEETELWGSFEVENSRYVWFVSYMLKVFDDLLRFDRETKWGPTVTSFLQPHVKPLKAIWEPHWKDHHSNRLGKIVKAVIEGAS